MAEGNTEQAADRRRPDIEPRPVPMAMCPMATMCGRMMERPPSGFLLMLPGSLLIIAGVLIFVEPRILVWLAATVSVLFGIMMLVMANLIRRFGVRLRNMSRTGTMAG